MKLITELRKLSQKVYFLDDTHSYISVNDPSKKYLSVSGFAKKLVEPFNEEYWALYKALEACGYSIKKANVGSSYWIDNKLVYMKDANKLPMTKTTPEIIKSEWNAKRDKGTTVGTHIHKVYEDNWRGKRHGSKYDVIYDFTIKNPHIIAIDTEIIVGDEELGIMGQIDALTANLKEKELQIRDLKTDDEIKFSNPYQKMFAPFDYLDDCNFNQYMIKINMYAYLFEKCTTSKIGKMFIDHISKQTFEHKVIPVPKIEMTHDIIRGIIDNKKSS
jgi:hypothetical protein